MKTAREEDPTDDRGGGIVMPAPKDHFELAEMGIDKDDGTIEDALPSELSEENSSAHGQCGMQSKIP